MIQNQYYNSIYGTVGGQCPSKDKPPEQPPDKAQPSPPSTPPQTGHQLYEKHKNKNIMKYNNTKTWRQAIANAWLELAQEESFAGMTLVEYQAATEATMTERANLEAIRREERAAIARRETADKTTRAINKRVVHAVQASPAHGPNSALYRAMGYITEDERASGLTRKNQNADQPSDE
jgi:membrane-bound lytic murein transglycosylase B